MTIRCAPFRGGVPLDDHGLTLIEVMIASLIMIVVLFWLAQYYVSGRRHLDYEEDRRRATALAQARLDEVRRWSYPYLLSHIGAPPHDTTVTVENRSYTVRLVAAAGPNPHTTTVSAIVSWNATLPYAPGNVFTRQDTVTTLIARIPIP
jgi:hypothetical protein